MHSLTVNLRDNGLAAFNPTIHPAVILKPLSAAKGTKDPQLLFCSGRLKTSGKLVIHQRATALNERFGDLALVDAWGIAGVKRLWGLSFAIIFEPQPVQMARAEGEAARRDRLLPTGHR